MRPPSLRHNVAALGADYALFLLGLAFVSPSTVLPAFAAWLGAPNVVIGAIPAVMTLGWMLPPLFAARHTERLSRKLPFIVRWTVWERVPFLVLAAAAFALAERAPGFTLALMLVMLLVLTGIGGMLMPAWMDLIGRAIPVTMRGRFFAVAGVTASGAGLGAAAFTGHVLQTLPPATAYAICFLAAGACLLLSFVALVLVREPAGQATPRDVELGRYLRQMPALIRGDRNLAWFLGGRALSQIGAMATVFYTVHALGAWKAPAAAVGVFTALLLGGSLVGTVAFGWLADRAGHRVVILIGVAAGFIANLTALAAPSLSIFAAAFVLAGVQQASNTISALTVLLEFAPVPEQQPTYVGLGHTVLAPVSLLAPIAAGVLADAVGLVPVFATAACGGLAALAVMTLRVRDPRHLAAVPREAPA